jgi:hypothetical protein
MEAVRHAIADASEALLRQINAASTNAVDD